MWIFLLAWSNDVGCAEGRWTLVSGSFIFELASCFPSYSSTSPGNTSGAYSHEYLKEKHSYHLIYFLLT